MAADFFDQILFARHVDSEGGHRNVHRARRRPARDREPQRLEDARHVRVGTGCPSSRAIRDDRSWIVRGGRGDG